MIIDGSRTQACPPLSRHWLTPGRLILAYSYITGCANPSRLLGAVLVHFCLEQKLAHCGSGGGSGHSDVECGSGGICDQLRLT